MSVGGLAHDVKAQEIEERFTRAGAKVQAITLSPPNPENPQQGKHHTLQMLIAIVPIWYVATV